MTSIETDAPQDNDALRRAIYDGTIFLLPRTTTSFALTDRVTELLVDELGEPLRQAHERFDADEFFVRIGRIRRILFVEREFHELVFALAAELGFDPEQIAFDPMRLRVIAHEGHENPRAAPVYYAHRDTWYAHPQSLITWWVPLDDLREEETFVFYPERFRAPVPNDSEIFDYDAWVRDGWGLKIGWQDRDAGLKARYPGVTREVDPGREIGFSCERGQNLLFSGSHFHRTREQALGTTRYSLDFRIVQLEDHAQQRGAPNVDNRSRGSALVDYVRSSAEP